MNRVQRNGFTLIELLVVVAIIALLISLLLPNMAKAKEVTRRAACAANMHAIGQGYRVYASEFNESVPIGINANGSMFSQWDASGNLNFYARDNREGSFLMYSQNPNINGFTACSYKGIGMLWASGAFGGGGPGLCPTALINIPERRPGGLHNPVYPPKLLDVPGLGDLYNQSTGVVQQTTRSVGTYSVRPCIPKEDQMTTSVVYHLVPQGNSSTNTWRSYAVNDQRYYNSAPLPPAMVYDVPFGGVSGWAGNIRPMPKAYVLKSSTAIAADLVAGKAYVDIVHKEGINVLRADGSAAWIKRGIIEPQLSIKALAWSSAGEPSWNLTNDYYNSSGPSMTKLWELLDQN